MAIRFEPLDIQHERSAFVCNSTPLTRYLREYATQDIRRKLASCFVATPDARQILGYYTLSTSCLPLASLPEEISRKLPLYPTVPTICLGRLAVDNRFEKQGIGKALLFDALARSARQEIAAFGMSVKAKNEEVAAFYRHFGFIEIEPLVLLLRFATLTLGD